VSGDWSLNGQGRTPGGGFWSWLCGSASHVGTSVRLQRRQGARCACAFVQCQNCARGVKRWIRGAGSREALICPLAGPAVLCSALLGRLHGWQPEAGPPRSEQRRDVNKLQECTVSALCPLCPGCWAGQLIAASQGWGQAPAIPHLIGRGQDWGRGPWRLMPWWRQGASCCPCRPPATPRAGR